MLTCLCRQRKGNIRDPSLLDLQEIPVFWPSNVIIKVVYLRTSALFFEETFTSFVILQIPAKEASQTGMEIFLLSHGASVCLSFL